ncbi:hypothetical protein ACFVSW_10165 [Neobacillus sp. NPDC058068]|uniref:hypothetical protein n=1 Tax=Neobacillus sp. NPDC058068 TaxID=3346325 RepID=UPI0036D922B1
MTVLTRRNFQTSEIKKMVNPNPTILRQLEELEILLSDLNLYDEVKELFGSPYCQLVYKKDGEEIFVIGLNKSNSYFKLSGYKWDPTPFLKLPIQKEFSIEKTLSWKLSDLEMVEPSKLENAVKESINNSKDLVQLMRYILVVISAYVSKASFLNEDANKLKSLVLEHFWKGEINVISELSEQSKLSKRDHFNAFIIKWQEQLQYKCTIDTHYFSNEMDIDRLQLMNLIKTIQVYFNQSVNKYIHSIKNLWFDADLIQDEEKFYEKVKEIRSKILIAQEYLNDMEVLLNEEESERERQVEGSRSAESQNDSEPNTLSQFLYEQAGNSTPFLNKEDIFTGNPTLVINEDILDKLAGSISNGNKNKKEYSNLIRIIFNKSLTKGFTVREIVRTFFISKYDNESERKDFEQRYDVKRLFVKSVLENVFEILMDKLKELNIIKEELSVIQSKQQKKMSFNLNFQIYDKY